MERDLVLVTTDKDHLCGRCRKLIPASSNALMGEVKILDRWERPIQVKVYYHNPKCQPLKAQQVRRPHIDPRVAKRKGRRKKRQWQGQ